jgi:general secretion pathway protein A
MWEKRFGLNRRPFPAVPDVSLYYPASPHEQALAPLIRAVHEDEGLTLLTAEPGLGKTLLGQVLLERLGDKVVSAFIPNTHFADRTALLQAILYDFGQPYDDGREQILRLRLTDFALKQCSEGKRTVVVIDEAHHLSADLLEELRLLGNLEGGRKAFQVVCLALPSIHETLRRPELAAWSQRVVVRATLAPLSVEESLDYLLHHLRVSGGRPEKIIDESGLKMLAQGALGIPRLLNQAAHQSLTMADAVETAVDAEVAMEALASIGLEVPECDEEELESAGEEGASFEVGGSAARAA